jgi:hypothetical protein
MHVMQNQQHQLAATSVSNQMSELIIGSPHWESGGLQSLVHGAYLDQIQQWCWCCHPSLLKSTAAATSVLENSSLA